MPYRAQIARSASVSSGIFTNAKLRVFRVGVSLRVPPSYLPWAWRDILRWVASTMGAWTSPEVMSWRRLLNIAAYQFTLEFPCATKGGHVKRITLVLAAAVALWGMNALAQGRGQGRPSSTGLEHAKDTANVHGQRGIENAETKQIEHKKDKSKKSSRKHSGKHKGDSEKKQ